MNLNHAMNVRSDFSIGESMLQIEQVIECAKTHGYESVALVDTMTISSMPSFAQTAAKAGIKPVTGVRLRVVEDPTYRKPSKASGEKEKPNPMFFLKAYPLNENGMRSLIRLLSKANSKEYFYYHARVGFEDVLLLEDCAVSTGDFYSIFHHPRYGELIDRLEMRFGRDKTFIELVPINSPLWDTLNHKALNSARLKGLSPLVTYPFLYRDNGDAPTLEVLNAITGNTKMEDRWRPRQQVRDFGFKAPTDIAKYAVAANKRIAQYYAPVEAAGELWKAGLANVETLAGLCHYEFKKLAPCLPKMADNEFASLLGQVQRGWAKRFSAPVLGHQPTKEELDAHYKPRLKYELEVLKAMGFSGYFLLVQDLVGWAKRNAIIVGPGRGSVGGSLVAYLMGITEVDPIRFNLFFERFINPSRQDLPDADLDFMSSKRHLVIEHLRDAYGEDRVAGISNYATLASASALRDTGRVYGLSGLEMMATKLVPKENGQSFTLDEAAKAVPDIEKFKNENPEIWAHATKLEGAMRSLGKHAAGIVVAGEPLVNRAVVETRGDESDVPVVSWDKRVVEDFGLIKMDILGLSTLDVLEIAKGYIQDRHGVTVDYTQLPLDDADIMDAFGRGLTTGVFQFESPGMKRLLKDLRMGGRLTFGDITAATALYRPGPMESGMMEDFVATKQGIREVFYEHPLMEHALKNTYGVIVYQEQVMQVARDLAGFTMAEADNLRKAMGKKDKEKMAALRDQWVAGCIKSGMGETQAGMLFDKIEAFAGYGFNASHAVEYSIISYWTMWVKVKYPAEFFAAALSVVKEEKLEGLVRDARAHGIELLPPDINRSSKRFEIVSEVIDGHVQTAIVAPFNAIKGVSENTAQYILDARAAGNFMDREDFLKRVNKTRVNKRIQEALDRVGAFARIEGAAALAPRHPDRRKDQMELLPGLIIDTVKATRTTDGKDRFLQAKIIHIVHEARACTGCDLAGGVHPTPRLGRSVKFMVVADSPNRDEEEKNRLLEGDGADFLKQAMKAHGLTVNDGYFTCLVKSPKAAGEKFLSNAQILACSPYLDREVELIKPPVIVALGSNAIRHFAPTLKGGTNELAGKTVYLPGLDATLVCGINPAQVYFDPSKQTILDDLFAKVAEMVA